MVQDKDGALVVSIMSAVATDATEALKLILDTNPAIESDFAGQELGPLHLAAQLGNLQICEMLVEAGADVNEPAPLSKATPLHFAAAANHRSVAEFLAKRMDDPTRKDGGGWTPLHVAAYHGSAETFEALLGFDMININAVGSEHRLTPLHLAAYAGRANIVPLLFMFEDTADVNACDAKRRTPLHLGAFSGDVKVISELLSFGARKNDTDDLLQKPVDVADQCGHKEAAELLRNAPDVVVPRPRVLRVQDQIHQAAIGSDPDAVPEPEPETTREPEEQAQEQEQEQEEGLPAPVPRRSTFDHMEFTEPAEMEGHEQDAQEQEQEQERDDLEFVFVDEEPATNLIEPSGPTPVSRNTLSDDPTYEKLIKHDDDASLLYARLDFGEQEEAAAGKSTTATTTTTTTTTTEAAADGGLRRDEGGYASVDDMRRSIVGGKDSGYAKLKFAGSNPQAEEEEQPHSDLYVPLATMLSRKTSLKADQAAVVPPSLPPKEPMLVEMPVAEEQHFEFNDNFGDFDTIGFASEQPGSSWQIDGTNLGDDDNDDDNNNSGKLFPGRLAIPDFGGSTASGLNRPDPGKLDIPEFNTHEHDPERHDNQVGRIAIPEFNTHEHDPNRHENNVGKLAIPDFQRQEEERLREQRRIARIKVLRMAAKLEGKPFDEAAVYDM